MPPAVTGIGQLHARLEDRALVAVLDATGGIMRVRLLISAATPDQWGPRCELREHMAAWPAKHHPDCIPDPSRKGRPHGW